MQPNQDAKDGMGFKLITRQRTNETIENGAYITDLLHIIQTLLLQKDTELNGKNERQKRMTNLIACCFEYALNLRRKVRRD